VGRTIHEDAAEEELADPDQAQHLHTVAARLREGRLPDWLAARVGQTPARPDSWPPHQVAAVASFMTKLAFGRVDRRRIRVGASPGADVDRAGNVAGLQGLPALFVAHLSMIQHGADCDGLLEWTEPVVTWRTPPPPSWALTCCTGSFRRRSRCARTRYRWRSDTPRRTAPSRTCSLRAPWPAGRTTMTRRTSWSNSSGPGLCMGTRPLPADVEPVRVL
jgi:hypothetical protein